MKYVATCNFDAGKDYGKKKKGEPCEFDESLFKSGLIRAANEPEAAAPASGNVVLQTTGHISQSQDAEAGSAEDDGAGAASADNQPAAPANEPEAAAPADEPKKKSNGKSKGKSGQKEG